MLDLIGALVLRHTGRPARSVVPLGEGTDNTVHEVDGGLVVRLSKEQDPARRADLVRREAALLKAVAGLSPIPVPVPVFTDPDAGALAYRKLPGRPLTTAPVAHPERLGPALGVFLTRLHRAGTDRLAALAPPDDHPLPCWRDDAERDYEAVAHALPPEARRPVEGFLAATPPPEPDRSAFCHNDLGAEHLLVERRAHAVTAVVDWTDAAVTDPARDLALIFRDLGPGALDRTLAHYGAPWTAADRDRAVFYARCALLEDIAYGLRTGARRYADAGLAHLAHTFAA